MRPQGLQQIKADHTKLFSRANTKTFTFRPGRHSDEVLHKLREVSFLRILKRLQSVSSRARLQPELMNDIAQGRAMCEGCLELAVQRLRDIHYVRDFTHRSPEVPALHNAMWLKSGCHVFRIMFVELRRPERFSSRFGDDDVILIVLMYPGVRIYRRHGVRFPGSDQPDDPLTDLQAVCIPKYIRWQTQIDDIPDTEDRHGLPQLCGIANDRVGLREPNRVPPIISDSNHDHPPTGIAPGSHRPTDEQCGIIRVGRQHQDHPSLARFNFCHDRSISRSQPVTLNVRPLPTQGRPANFTGLVGQFSIDASAQPTQVSVGDPIDLRVRITGPEPLDRLLAPDLARDPAFAGPFRLSADGLRLDSSQNSGSRTYSTTLRATSDRVTRVPPVELAYFDTRAGEYRVARSQPIPLTVRPTRQVTAGDAITVPHADSSSASRRAPTSLPLPPPIAQEPILSSAPGLRANSTSLAALRNQHADLRTSLCESLRLEGRMGVRRRVSERAPAGA